MIWVLKFWSRCQSSNPIQVVNKFSFFTRTILNRRMKHRPTSKRKNKNKIDDEVTMGLYHYMLKYMKMPFREAINIEDPWSNLHRCANHEEK